MKVSVLSLAVASATLVSASLMFSPNPAQAFELTYFFFDGQPLRVEGTFVADSETGLLSSISGMVYGRAGFWSTIVTLLPLWANQPVNDNLIPLTLSVTGDPEEQIQGGIAFSDTASKEYIKRDVQLRSETRR